MIWQTNFMQVSTKYTQGDNTVTVESIYRLKRAIIPTQGYADVKKFRNELYQKNEQYIVLKKKSNSRLKLKHGSRGVSNRSVYLRRKRMRRGV